MCYIIIYTVAETIVIGDKAVLSPLAVAVLHNRFSHFMQRLTHMHVHDTIPNMGTAERAEEVYLSKLYSLPCE